MGKRQNAGSPQCFYLSSFSGSKNVWIMWKDIRMYVACMGEKCSSSAFLLFLGCFSNALSFIVMRIQGYVEKGLNTFSIKINFSSLAISHHATISSRMLKHHFLIGVYSLCFTMILPMSSASIL